MTHKSKVKKCLIYCRISDLKQKEGSGLESQEYRCRQKAAELGLPVERVFKDVYSGGGDYTKRPGMIELLNFLEKKQKENFVLLFDDLKRLARDTMFHWQLRHAMKNFGAQLVCLNYSFDETPEGEFMETLFAAQGQLERQQIGRQTRQKTEARLLSGYYSFVAPVGFKYMKSKTEGKILIRDEPVASIIQEGMEGFASGRFQTKVEVKRFFEAAPEFPKQSSSGRIGNNQVDAILQNPLYAGFIEFKPWGVSLRQGRHEGMVSYEKFCIIQDRLNGRAYVPARKDLNKDFVLRNFVTCVCGNALTAAWSKSGTGKRHAYYVCQNRKCDLKGKSVRRDKLEAEFEDLLATIVPNTNLVRAFGKMLKKHWDHLINQQAARSQVLEKELGATDKKIEQLLDRIVDANSSEVAKSLESRLETLQNNKIILREKMEQCGRPARPFDDLYRTAMDFIANPLSLWRLGGYEGKRTVLKLVFSGRIEYDRTALYRTPVLAAPFRALRDLNMLKNKMVPEAGLEPARPVRAGGF